MNQLLKNYSFMCEAACQKRKDNLPDNPTTQQIRKYFLITHNLETLKSSSPITPYHLAIPYNLHPDNTATLAKPFYQIPDNLHKIRITKRTLEEINRLGIILPKKLDEIIITHLGIPVDTLSKKELESYLSKIS